MKVGLQISNFTWPGGPAQLGPRLAEIARTAEDVGFSSIWTMDHLFQIGQIGQIGPPEMDMLEAYTTLGFLAAHTNRVALGTIVTSVAYRHPGMLIKQVTTPDVLSGGRAWLGLGAAWFEREALGLGIPFPPLGERFERLEETLQIAHQMWQGDTSPFAGKHYQLAEPMNSPAPLSRPRPPILIGGGGEQKTLRFVAKYADACNLFGASGQLVRQKLAVLREHCDREGRDYDAIEKTAIYTFDVGDEGQNASKLVDHAGELAEAGIQTLIGSVTGAGTIKPFEIMGRDVIPQMARL